MPGAGTPPLSPAPRPRSCAPPPSRRRSSRPWRRRGSSTPWSCRVRPCPGRGVPPAPLPPRRGPSPRLCPRRLLDGHRAAERLSHGHVHVPAGAAGSAPREAALGARCRRECAGGKCQPPARQPRARFTGSLRLPAAVLTVALELCPPVPTPAQRCRPCREPWLPRSPGAAFLPSRTPAPRSGQTASLAPM